jgi:chromatin assembly factor 1 subunit A
MDVSIESTPAAAVTPSVGSQCFQPAPPSPTHSRKRAFSEVDEPNVLKQQEMHKYQKKHDGADDQENRNPLQQGDQMVIDKPATTTTTTTSTMPATSNSSNTQNAQTGTAAPTLQEHVFINSTSPLPVPPSTPQLSSDTTAAAKKQKISPNTKEAKRLEKEEKDRLKLEEKAKKDEEKRIKDEERKKKEIERDEEKKKRDAEREEERKRREEKKKAKEEEKLARDEEKRKREEEKVKKERVSINVACDGIG